eukprot:9573-Alexandrium_andersonii.AAC.1
MSGQTSPACCVISNLAGAQPFFSPAVATAACAPALPAAPVASLLVEMAAPAPPTAPAGEPPVGGGAAGVGPGAGEAAPPGAT